MSDWQHSDRDCPKCNNQMATQDCASCFGEGFFDDEDDDWGDDTCFDCKGRGFEEWCRECGWDAIHRCFLDHKYEKEWLKKQAQENQTK